MYKNIKIRQILITLTFACIMVKAFNLPFSTYSAKLNDHAINIKSIFLGLA